MITKLLSESDVKSVARLHQKAFKNFFLTKLGNKFLVEFYRAIMNSSDSINIGLFDNDELIGFAVGSRRGKFFYRNLLKKNFFKLIYSALVPLISNPRDILRLITSFSSIGKSNQDLNDVAVLLSFCIDSNHSSKGLGGILLKEFENSAFKYSNAIALTTDADDNDYVKRFYARNNFELHNTYYQGKRRMGYYLKHKRTE